MACLNVLQTAPGKTRRAKALDQQIGFRRQITQEFATSRSRQITSDTFLARVQELEEPGIFVGTQLLVGGTPFTQRIPGRLLQLQNLGARLPQDSCCIRTGNAG